MRKISSSRGSISNVPRVREKKRVLSLTQASYLGLISINLFLLRTSANVDTSSWESPSIYVKEFQSPFLNQMLTRMSQCLCYEPPSQCQVVGQGIQEVSIEESCTRKGGRAGSECGGVQSEKEVTSESKPGRHQFARGGQSGRTRAQISFGHHTTILGWCPENPRFGAKVLSTM